MTLGNGEFMNLFHRAAALSLAVVTLAATLIGTPAQAEPVTVGGTTYDVQFFQGPRSFNDDETALRNTPWFGNQALASDFADAYGTQVSKPYPFDVTSDVEFLLFAYSESRGLVENEFLDDDGNKFSLNTTAGDNFAPFQYAYTSPLQAVPEIDGNALSQAALILLALWLGLRGRRGLA